MPAKSPAVKPVVVGKGARTPSASTSLPPPMLGSSNSVGNTAAGSSGTATKQQKPKRPTAVIAEATSPFAPLTLVDAVDAVITHFADLDANTNPSFSSVNASSASKPSPDREQLLWAIRTYCFSAAVLPKLGRVALVPSASEAPFLVADNANVASFDLTSTIKYINEMLARSSATAFNGLTDTAAASSSSSEGKAAEQRAVPPMTKRPREEPTVAGGAAAADDAEAASRLADPSAAVTDSNLISEPHRHYLFDVSTCFDFTAFMAWRATHIAPTGEQSINNNNSSSSTTYNVVGASSLLSSAATGISLNTSTGSASIAANPNESTTSSVDATMPPPDMVVSPRGLLSPTTNLVSHHASPVAAAYFDKCKELLVTPITAAKNAPTATSASSSPLIYANDGAFVEFIEMLIYTQTWVTSVNNLSVPATLHRDVVRIVEQAGVSLRTIVLCANACFALLQVVGGARLAASAEKPPRLVRMCASFNFKVSESCAMAHVLAVHTGSLINHTIPHPLGFACVSRASGLDPQALQAFLQSDRSHIRQGVLHPADQMMAKVSPDMRILMPLEVASSLCGSDIPEEELVKLENTCLWNVLQAEKNNNWGVIATKGRKASSAAAAYLASAGTGSNKKQRKVTFGNSKLAAALGDLLTSGNDNDDAANSSSDSSDGDNESGAATPRTPGGMNRAESDGDLETLDNDDGMSSKAGTMSLLDGGSGLDSISTASNDTPYANDIEYLDDCFRVLAMMVKARNSEGDMKDEDDLYFATPKSKVEAQLREFAGKQRVIQKRVEMRMNATRNNGTWIPRVERVSERLRLSPFEKQLLMLMVGNVVSHDVLVAINGRSVMRDGARELTVGYILFVLCASLPERVACRKCFFESSPLIANGLISLSVGTSSRTRFNTDLMEYLVDIDRSIVDYLMGTDIDPDEMVQGSRLYTPDVPLSHVALPASIKDKVLSTIEHYSLFAKCKERCGFGKGLGTGGSGLVFLFHGPSGTGKTMLANAVAHDLKKKILLVNLLQYRGDAKAPDVLRYVFREAKLNDAIIFFDECESFFEQRENNSVVTAVLAEFERYSGMIILATNRAQVIDEAMNRRISLMIEFKLPDHQMREQIWKTHLPSNLKMADDISVQELAMDYELSGGLIRNAVLAALSSAVGREKCDNPTLTMADVRQGAKQQLRGFFQANETASQEYITPLRSLDEVIVDRSTKESIVNIAKIVKSRNTLFAQWGFDEKEYDDQGEICLFYGASGTGKSLAAEGIAYECSATIRLCNVSEMFLTNSFNIQGVFDEARKLGAIVVFDQAQGLFDYSDMAAKISQLIQYHAVRYPRPVIVIATTSPSGVSSIDTRASRILFNTEIMFQLPTRQLRKELWRRSIPAQVPTADNVDFEKLSAEQLSAKAIRSICFSVCCKAALLPPGKQLVSMELITEVQEEFLSRERRRNTHSSMFT